MLSEYRRMHPEFIPSEKFFRISSAGHTTTYADSIWISLIQYVGDNIRDRGYDTFAPVLLDRIHSLHPSFTKPYEFSMLLLPTIFSNETGTGVIAKKKLVQIALDTLERDLGNFCNLDTVNAIKNTTRISDLWEKKELANPCRSGQIPYYMAFHYYNDLGQNQKAKEYYMIAAANTDTPIAGRYLIGLMDGESGDHFTAAFSLVSIALEGEDDESGQCTNASVETMKVIGKSLTTKNITTDEVQHLSALESNLFKNSPPKKTSTPSIDCRDYFSRAMKQVFLAYVTNQAKAMEKETGKTAKNSRELEQAGYLPFFPKMSETPDYNYYFNPVSSLWEYTLPDYAPI